MDLISQCALGVAKVMWRPGHGGFAFTVVCKATFELRPDVSPLAVMQEPVFESDVHTGEGGGLALASDLVPLKKRPEVLVTGYAYASEGRPVQSLVARLAVGEIDKTIQVVGDRYFDRYGRLSDPAPFTRMPLVWERAASGPDMSNPVGRPVGDAARADFSGRVPAPNLLPIGLLLTSRSDIVQPVGFGPIAPMWPSRAACLHQHVAWWNPSRWHERPLPADIDLAYFNAAPPDQQRALPFGEEVLYLECLHPRFAHLSTRLAPVMPTVMADHGSGAQPLQLRCDTLVIDTDRGLAMLVWRAHVLLDHPDRPGRVVVTGLAAPEAELPAWTRKAPKRRTTLVPDIFIPPAVVLPFSGAATPAPVFGPPPAPVGATAPAPAATAGENAAPALSSGAGQPITNSVSTETLDPGLMVQAAALPFGSSQSEDAFQREAPPWGTTSFVPPRSYSVDEEGIERTLVPTPVLPAAVLLPFDSLQGEGAPRREIPLGESTSALPFMPSSAHEESDDPPTPRQQDSTDWQPPHLTGASRATPTAEADSPGGPALVAEPEPGVTFHAYPPERCGAIAGRLACDGDSTSDILRAEDLDVERWKCVHEHWLDRIRDESTRGRKKLLSDYDGAYVSALEAKRGPITLDDYARLAEAAERSAAAGALVERGLPEGAWPHIHRVWIGRMVKDVRLGKQVRVTIDALRAAE